MKFFNRMFRNAKGATSIEYGLIAALIVVAAVAAMSSLGKQLENSDGTSHATSH